MKMEEKYLNWINENVYESYGKCTDVTLQMSKVFPELKRIRGFYYCPIFGKREHWWLVDIYGNIVDPTKKQFPSGGVGVYEEWIEGSNEPTGKCPNCGGYCFNESYCCSQECHNEYVQSIKQNLIKI